MEYVNLGGSGLMVSRLCLGTMTYGSPEWRDWVLPEEESRPFFERALELGINFFDTADFYSMGASEEVVGRALRDMAKRDEVVMATKVYFAMGEGPNQRGLSRKHIMEGAHNSLRRLGTDYIDLYQIHRWDDGTPIDETLAALHDLVKAGKVLYIGASSMHAWQFCQALYKADLNGWTRFVSMQNHYNLLNREEEREMLPLCRDQGIGVIPWSPLARGYLAGTITRERGAETARSRSDDLARRLYDRDLDWDIIDRVGTVAQERGVSMAQVALTWLLHQPDVAAPIVGASKLRHLDQLAGATEIELSQEERTYLEELYQPRGGSFL